MKKVRISLSEVPLVNLSVRLERAQAGLSDFVVEILPAKADPSKFTPIRFRADRDATKLTGTAKMAKIFFRRMAKRDDDTFEWEKGNAEHLAKMLFPHMKHFGMNVGIKVMEFWTDAIK